MIRKTKSVEKYIEQKSSEAVSYSKPPILRLQKQCDGLKLINYK